MPASEQGQQLYENNCAACHGETGYADGDAALAVEIRPRNFREELFRYVSTMNGVPQRKDLVRTIRDGRRYGEMPAHPHLTGREVDVLVDYVLALHRLGWEARLKAEAGEGEELEAAEIKEIATEKITPKDPVAASAPPPGFRPTAVEGHRLFLASCASCHGPAGRGDGLEETRSEAGLSLDPLQVEEGEIEVRDLTTGEFRGGTSLPEVFKRIRCGVPGTPMASQALLRDEDIWQLAYYSLYLAGRYSYGD